MRILVATNNPDKAREMAAILSRLSLEVVIPEDLGGWEPPEESGSTVEENATLKAQTAFERFGVPAVADDTALEVDSLGGAPGIYSARYAGEGATYEENRVKLLSAMRGLESPAERRARFRTVVAAVGFDEKPILAEGVVAGYISTEERGSGGFGYDPIFVLEGSDRTFAEMSPEEKNASSHRAKALESLVEALTRYLASTGGTKSRR